MDLKHFKGPPSPLTACPPNSTSVCHGLRGGAAMAGGSGFAPTKWIDQAQSLNIYMAGASGKKLDDTYSWPGCARPQNHHYLRTKAPPTWK